MVKNKKTRKNTSGIAPPLDCGVFETEAIEKIKKNQARMNRSGKTNIQIVSNPMKIFTGLFIFIAFSNLIDNVCFLFRPDRACPHDTAFRNILFDRGAIANARAWPDRHAQVYRNAHTDQRGTANPDLAGQD